MNLNGQTSAEDMDFVCFAYSLGHLAKEMESHKVVRNNLKICLSATQIISIRPN